MQCPSCHNEIAPQAAFCGACGVSADSASSVGSISSIPAAPATGGLSQNAAAAISYITIIPAIIFLVLEPYNKMRLVRFHAIQSIALTVAWIAVWIALMILHVVLHFIPLVGVLFLLADLVVAVCFFVAWLLAIFKASKGEYFKLPIIGGFAGGQTGS